MGARRGWGWGRLYEEARGGGRVGAWRGLGPGAVCRYGREKGGRRREKGVADGTRGTVRPRAHLGYWVGWTVCGAVRVPSGTAHRMGPACVALDEGRHRSQVAQALSPRCARRRTGERRGPGGRRGRRALVLGVCLCAKSSGMRPKIAVGTHACARA